MTLRKILFNTTVILFAATAAVNAQSFSKTNYFVDTLRFNGTNPHYWEEHWLDVDGDQDLDLIFAVPDKSYARSDRLYWIENEDHSFDNQRPIKIKGVGSIRFEVADIDGNGTKDIIYASTDDDRIAWLPNERGDTFPLEFTINNPDTDGDIFNDANGDADHVTSLKVADIDRDGDPDIVFGNGDKIGWYLNEGDGTFSDQQFIDPDGKGFKMLANIRGDSSLDAIGNGHVFEYRSADGFLPAVSIPPGEYVDFDRDGFIDVIKRTYNQDVSTFHKNRGDSTFDEGIPLELGLGAYEEPVWHGDIDGDKDIDRFGFNRAFFEWVWYENTGNYEFTRHWVPQPSSDTTYNTIDDSIRTDLTYYSSPNQFGYYTFNQDSALVPVRVIENPAYYDPVDFSSADLNNDGIDDVAIAFRSKNLTVHISQPDGTFSTRELPYYAGEYGKGIIRKVRFGDVDADGDMDLLRVADHSLSWYINEGSGVFGDSFVFYQSDIDQLAWSTDVNGDGYADVITRTLLGNEIAWLENKKDQSFQSHVIKELPDFDLTEMDVVDINGDGKEDLVYLREKGVKDRIVYWENTGEGEYLSSGQMLVEKVNLSNLYVADVDADGDNDIVYGRTSGTHPDYDRRTMWLENKGAGSFANKGKRLVEYEHPVRLSDLDLDGDMDVVTPKKVNAPYNNRYVKLFWQENEGNLQFSSPKKIGGWEGAVGKFQLAQMSDDQKADILVLEDPYYGNQIGWLQNNIPRKHTAIGKDENRPRSFSLGENYPNPFNPTTTIQYSIPEAAEVNISIYNALGQRVATLLNQREKAGEYTVSFDGKRLSSGVYVYRIQAGDYTESKKMLLLK